MEINTKDSSNTTDKHGISFVSYAIVSAFLCYFAMYAFRKPFSAASFEGLYWFGMNVQLKESIVAWQIVGYALSKVIGIKVCSELKGHRREVMLVSLILISELALIVFGALPDNFKFLPIALNGLALGMVWGLVVSYLEGRKTSELLLAGLSCSFIMSSGIVKDFGRAVLAGEGAEWWHGVPFLSQQIVDAIGPVSEGWMPSVVGLHFLPIFLLSVYMLKRLPGPTAEDVAERSERGSMDNQSRFDFLKKFSLGLLVLCVTYLLITVYRDYRDNFQVDIFNEMGYDGEESDDIMSKSEAWVSLAIILGLGSLYLLRHRYASSGLLWVWLYMLLGIVLMAAGAISYSSDFVSGFQFMVISGIGAYMCYVPFGSVLFDQVIASTRFKGNAVFAIYIADAVGYLGVVAFLFSKDAVFGKISKLGMYTGLTWVMVAVGCVGLVWSYFYFRGKELAAQVQLNQEAEG